MSLEPHVWVVGGGVFANPPVCSRWDCLADIRDPIHVDEATANERTVTDWSEAPCEYPGCGQPPAYPAHNRFLTTGDELSAHTYQPEVNR